MTNTTNTANNKSFDLDTKQDYTTHTAHYVKQIAEVMREPQNRITYRIQVLRKTGVLEHKYDMSETAKELRKLRKELKVARAELKQLKAVA